MSVIGDADLYYFAEGSHRHAYGFLGAHIDGDRVHFAVWAPNAYKVYVIGDFNDWIDDATELHPVDSSGIFAGGAPAKLGDRYKYLIIDRVGARHLKADPFALSCELPPGNASIVTALDYQWHDGPWMSARGSGNPIERDWYAIHLASRQLPQVAAAFRLFLTEAAQEQILRQLGHVGGPPGGSPKRRARRREPR